MLVLRLLVEKFDIKKYMCDTSLFRKIFIMVLSFEMLAFLDIPFLIIKCFVLSWGFFILVHNFFMEKRAFKVKYRYLLWAFLISMTITSFMNISIWLIPNIALVLYTSACFFMFYGMYMENTHHEVEKEMVFILKFFVVFGTICGFLSLTVLLWQHEIKIGSYNLGIYKNRLIGIYTNSNILAFSMVESIISCDILSDRYIKNNFKGKIFNSWILVLCVTINCICLFLSDSNASFLFFVTYLTIRVFCNMFFKNKASYGIKFIKSMVFIIGFCVVSMSVSFALRDACQRFIGEAMSETSRQEILQEETNETGSSIKESGITIVVPTPEKAKGSSEEKKEEQFHIGREHYEVSSGRITLLKQGIEIFKHNPIMGIGRANLGLYAKMYLKDGLRHPDLHNGYLTILVCYGIVGFLIFAIFSFLVAVDVCKHMFECVNHNYFGVFTKLFSVLVGYCGYCLFEKAILFDVTFMVGFFWIMLGFTVSYMSVGRGYKSPD